MSCKLELSVRERDFSLGAAETPFSFTLSNDPAYFSLFQCIMKGRLKGWGCVSSEGCVKDPCRTERKRQSSHERQQSGNVIESLSKSRKLVLIKFIEKYLKKIEEKRPPTQQIQVELMEKNEFLLF